MKQFETFFKGHQNVAHVFFSNAEALAISGNFGHLFDHSVNYDQ